MFAVSQVNATRKFYVCLILKNAALSHVENVKTVQSTFFC